MTARIELRDVDLLFPIYTREMRSFRTVLKRQLRGERFRQVEGSNNIFVHGLKAVNLNLKQGDTLALLGPNGAGKTSLLKLLSGIYAPSHGTIEREGMVSCLLDFSLGMDEDATGYENIIISSMLRGYPPNKLDRILSDIVGFCELEDFLYMPLRTYSAGMRTRLGYAITTSIMPDILLIDEMFSAGDASFVNKSVERMTNVIKASSIFVFSTHDLGLAQRLCNRGLLLCEGEVRFDGPIEEAVALYLEQSKR